MVTIGAAGIMSALWRTDAAVVAPMSVVFHNSLLFGAALTVLSIVAFVASRLAARVARLGLRVARAGDDEVLHKMIARRISRVVSLAAAVLGLALVSAAVVLSVHEIDATAPLAAALEAVVLGDPAAGAWRVAQVLALVLAVFAVHAVVRSVVDFVIVRVRGNPAFLRHHESLGRLRDRVVALLRWGARFGAALGVAWLLEWPAAVTGPLTAATYVVLGVFVARALVAVTGVGVDIGVHLVSAFGDRRAAGRYLDRLAHLGVITKGTLEYVCIVGTATFVVHRLQPETWLAQTGVIAIRLIALVYVGRVVIEVCGLALREVLLADSSRRSEAERQQRLTLVPVGTSVIRYAVYFCVAVMGLQETGVDTSPILAGAGLLGLAVGLGAQTLVGDVVSGFFILFEGLILVGDRIRVGEVIGKVEEVGIRVLRIRDEYGILHCIPNGEVRLVANHAREYVNAVVEFSLPYNEDIPGILDHLRGLLSEKRGTHPDILSDTDFSIQDLRDTGALVRSLTRVRPGCDDSVGDVIRVELFTALTTIGVMPSACYVVTLQRGARGRPLSAGPVEPASGA
jgi:moderate conductance mechanosensitive channel